jgi:nucleotide-binding universal stress UspA family protein
MTGQRLLVPVDGSSHSCRAAEYALKVARCMDKEILLIHFHKHFPGLKGEPYYQQAVSKILSQSQELLAPFRQLMVQAGINFEERIMEGPPGDRICEVAQLEKCEMIVMGSRGRSELRGLILGSVAQRVLHSAACPVLVVK